MFVTPYVRGKRQGTAMHYHEDGTKWEEVIWENGKEVSKKELLKRPNLPSIMYLFRLLNCVQIEAGLSPARQFS